ncbi:MAG: Eco57I restriction-modification methylase domain-containing protein [Gammaproteobacteria bacterium]
MALTTKKTQVLLDQERISVDGAVFTRPEVVDFILDLSGYTGDLPLHKMRILEPSFGEGSFLLPIIRRLLTAWHSENTTTPVFDDLKDAICAVEIHKKTFSKTFSFIIKTLEEEGISGNQAKRLAEKWLIHGDFLLADIQGQFDFVVGNPPYIRQELIPATLLAEYRKRYRTLYDRADIYVPFIERSLILLKGTGTLGFICADRWMKNRYGGPLRGLISQNFNLKIYVDMTNTPAFYSDVIAYPAIVILNSEVTHVTRAAYRPSIDQSTLTRLTQLLQVSVLPEKCKEVRELPNVCNGKDPWLIESSTKTSLIRRLESEYPTIEEAGCKISIGVATGADEAFIAEFEKLDVEFDRKLPLVTTRDIESGEVRWTGRGIVNPFLENGNLVDLEDYPLLRAYLECRKHIIANRHCAKKYPNKWYRTIDRITPSLVERKKLLIPDIKGKANVVFEDGKFYPHHNLYYVTSATWDLRALQGVLLSSLAKFFIIAYSTKMRGEYLRFQAQYLRRIRIPLWVAVPENIRAMLINAAINRDIDACNNATYMLYGLTSKEISTIQDDEV